jgi:hypothetical protein
MSATGAGPSYSSLWTVRDSFAAARPVCRQAMHKISRSLRHRQTIAHVVKPSVLESFLAEMVHTWARVAGQTRRPGGAHRELECHSTALVRLHGRWTSTTCCVQHSWKVRCCYCCVWMLRQLDIDIPREAGNIARVSNSPLRSVDRRNA